MDREEDFSMDGMAGRTLINATSGMKTRERLFFSFRRPLSTEPIEYDESFEELLKQTWTIWAVSTLFNFEYDSEVKMKLYAKKLREEVACSILKENVSYNAKFTVMENLGPRPSPTDAPAVKIELIATSGTVDKCIYNGVLISWRSSLAESMNDKCVNLPLLLCRGTQGAIKAVHSIVSRMFDCTIVALPIIENDLEWLFPINLCPESYKGKRMKNELVLLEYVVPGLPVTDTLSVKFRIEDVKDLWTSISKTHGDEESVQNIQTRHIEKFFEVLHKQMLEIGNLRLALCSLHKLSMPFITISGNRMKVMSTEAFNNTLLFLNEKALEVLHTLNITESMSLNSSATQSSEVSDARSQ